MPRIRCERCARPASHCLCALIPSLPSRTRVLVLQHPSEVGHALNTAGLAVLGLCNAELRVGERFAEETWRVPGYRACLLFPGEQARALAEMAAEAAGEPLLLVVPDGTWRKARKLLHLNPALAALPRVSLAEGMASRYRLRKAPGEGALSTIEAIAAALDELEAPRTHEALLKPFDALIGADRGDGRGHLSAQPSQPGAPPPIAVEQFRDCRFAPELRADHAAGHAAVGVAREVDQGIVFQRMAAEALEGLAEQVFQGRCGSRPGRVRQLPGHFLPEVGVATAAPARGFLFEEFGDARSGHVGRSCLSETKSMPDWQGRMGGVDCRGLSFRTRCSSDAQLMLPCLHGRFSSWPEGRGMHGIKGYP